MVNLGASEIDYPYTSSTDDGDDMSVELCGNVPVSSKSQEKSHLPCPRPCKKIRIDSANPPRTNLNLDISSSSISPDDHKSGSITLENIMIVENSWYATGQLDATKGVAGITARRNVATEILSCVQRLTPAERAHAIQIASSFQSTRNPVFMVVMQLSFIRSTYRMKKLNSDKGNLTLCNSTGKTWRANYSHSAENKRPIVLLCGGWRAFAVDNNLNVADICVFELIKHPEILMKVVIYPVVENASKACSPLADGSIARRVKTRSLVSDTEPNLPLKKIRIDSANQTGTNLKLKVSSSTISPGTIKLENLKKFENLHCSTGQLDATKGAGGITAWKNSATEVLGCVQPLTDTERARAVQIASTFKSSENPVFMVVMKPSFLQPNYRMVIPLNFAREFLTRQKGNLTLWDSTGKTWPAKYYHTAENKKPKAHLYGGWGAFVVDNCLTVGGICAFELIKHPEILMKVVIYPVVENARKACRPLVNGSIASPVKTRSLVSDTEPNFRHRQCPFSSRKFKDSKIEVNENLHSHMEILNEFLLNQKINKKLPSACFHPCKMTRTNPSRSIQAAEVKLKKQKNLNFQSLTKEIMGEFNYSAKDDSGGTSGARRCLKAGLTSGNMQSVTLTKKEGVFIQASAFNSANPSFTVVMQPSYVTSDSPVHMPNQFAKRYLKENGEVILRVSDGRTCVVDYQRKRSYADTIFHRNSWRAFMLHNNLKLGDICLFELIKENLIELEVVIFPAADTASCSS